MCIDDFILIRNSQYPLWINFYIRNDEPIAGDVGHRTVGIGRIVGDEWSDSEKLFYELWESVS